jgi:biotin carboxyl carrier protein
MYKINVNNKFKFEIEIDPDGKSGNINGQRVLWDSIKIKEGSFHVIKDHKSYNVELVKADYSEKTYTISVNGTKYYLSLKDRFDELLKELGMDRLDKSKINEIKAPMPGLVIDIRVEEGQTIKKGDALLVLEAMKMENILKSPTDGIVKKISVSKGVAVEKNQLLINFI